MYGTEEGEGRQEFGFNADHYMCSHIRGHGVEMRRAQNPLERRWNKIHSVTNGSNTHFSSPASKPHTPNHFCPHQNGRSTASQLRVWIYPSDSTTGMSKSTRSHSTTALRMCECVFKLLTAIVTCCNIMLKILRVRSRSMIPRQSSQSPIFPS